MKVLAFGIVKDIFNNSIVDVDLTDGASVEKLKILLQKQYPRLDQLGSYMISVNNEYTTMNYVIKKGDEVAIIPPVSGG